METWREGLFQLCWQQHGGSGLAVTLEDALDLPSDEVAALLDITPATVRSLASHARAALKFSMEDSDDE